MTKTVFEKLEKGKAFRILFDKSPDYIFIINRENKEIVDCNKKALKITGYSGKEIKGKHPRYLFPEETRKEDLKQFREKARKGMISYEKYLLTKKGKKIPVDISATTVNVEKMKLIIGIFRDISKREKEHRRYTKLFENSRDALMVLRPPEWRFSSVNSATLKIFNAKKEEELLEKCPHEVSPKKQPSGESSKKKAKKMLERALKKGSAFFEWRHKRLDGEEFPASVLLSRVKVDGEKFVQATVRDITERKRKERKLVEEKEKNKNFRKFLQKVINGLRNTFFVFDSDGNWEMWNKSMEKVTGYSSDEIRNMKPLDFFLGRDREKVKREIEKVFSSGHKAEIEAHVTTKDGKTIPYLFYGSTIKYNGKRLLIGTGTDITILKEIQKELKESEKKIRLIFNKVNEALYLHGITKDGKPGKFVEVNEVACRMLGYSKKEFMKMTPRDINSEETNEKTPGVMKKLSKKGKTVFEGVHVTKRGEEVPVEISLHRYNDEKGEPMIISAVRDISERKEEMMKRQSFQQIVRKADVGTIITDTNGKILSSNSAAKRAFGRELKAGRELGLPISEEISEIDIIRKDGKKGTGKMTSDKIVWQGEDAYLIFITDITEQREAREKIKEQVEKLKELNELRTQFLSMASHELKTPLTPIKAQLQLLQSGKISEEKKEESLDTVLRNVDRLNKLVEDILDISRINSGKMRIEKENNNLKKTIENAADTIEAEGIDIDTDVEKLPRISFDEDRISQVLLNLMENAIKHGRASKIKIIARKQDDKVRVEVRDDGKGISQNNLKRVFEPFERERNEKLAPGTGLGLAICQKIIEAHEGEIWAESVKRGKKKGTSVFFTLPLEKVQNNKKSIMYKKDKKTNRGSSGK